MAESFRWGGEPLDLETLDRIAASLSGIAKPRTSRFSHCMNVAIIGHFMGDAWLRKHAHLDADPASFLFPVFDANGVAPTYALHMLFLAEMLFNLQETEGFAACLENLTGAQIQSGLAELQVGALLAQRGVNFGYIDPKTDPGKTFDLEIVLPDGTVGCGEIKCKYENTPYTAASLTNSLRDARGQIGKGRDGIVFVKIPQDWTVGGHSDPNKPAPVKLPNSIVDAAEAALRGSSRLKKIIFYALHLAYDGTTLGATHCTMERGNPKNDPGSPWNAELLASPVGENWLSMKALNARWAHNARS